METTITIFTILTFLLFSLSTARIALDPTVIQTNNPEPESDKTASNQHLSAPLQTQTFFVPRQTHRRSFDATTRIPLRFVRRQPCRKFKNSFVVPTTRSYGNDMLVSDKTVTVDLETIGDQIPTKWLEFKHQYGHYHSRHHKDQKLEIKSEKKRGFMRRVRKFLKHTFG